MSERQFAVLIADDDEKDRALLTKTIRRHASHLKVVGEAANGEEVVAYLTGEGEYADREKNPLPKLLILDVRMPRMTGIEVLEWLRAQGFPDLKVALLADSAELRSSHEYVEMLARQQGASLRSFRDEASAVSWLTGDAQSQEKR